MVTAFKPSVYSSCFKLYHSFPILVLFSIQFNQFLEQFIVLFTFLKVVLYIFHFIKPNCLLFVMNLK